MVNQMAAIGPCLGKAMRHEILGIFNIFQSHHFTGLRKMMVPIQNNPYFTSNASKNRAIIDMPCDDANPSESQNTSSDS